MTQRTVRPARGESGPAWGSIAARRAIAMWPRLDMQALRRCRDDPHRIAHLVSRRTSMPVESIVRLLTMPQVSADEGATWFG